MLDDLKPIASEKKSLSRFLFANLRTVMIVLILFTVIVVMTTDIKLVTIKSITDLGLEFFLILVASYSMYVCCADGGIERGFKTSAYIEAEARYEELKARIEEGYISHMSAFCESYVEEELKRSRMKLLTSVCVAYDTYAERYMKLSRREIRKCSELTDRQKSAVIKANKIRRIKLTPEMILSRGKSVHSRSPLAYTPEACRGFAFGAKIVKMSFISACMSLIALDVILEPSWTVFAQVCLKLLTVVINGIDGDKEGFNNVAVHTVSYTNAQSQLMIQAIKFAEKN